MDILIIIYIPEEDSEKDQSLEEKDVMNILGF